MRFAIDLYLDPVGESKIKRMGTMLGMHGIKVDQFDRPFIRLGAFEDIAQQSIENNIKQVVDDCPRFQVFLPYVGLFPGAKTAFIGVVLDEKLMNFHRQVHVAIGDSVKNSDRRMLPDSWVPNCALVSQVRRDDLKDLFFRLNEIWQPIKCQVDKVGLVKLQPELTQLSTFPIKMKYM